jgi:hypothetical protein
MKPIEPPYWEFVARENSQVEMARRMGVAVGLVDAALTEAFNMGAKAGIEAGRNSMRKNHIESLARDIYVHACAQDLSAGYRCPKDADALAHCKEMARAFYAPVTREPTTEEG